MVVRKRKRRNKLLGQRTRGKGDTKNMRGAGRRGGRGLAGSHKHKYAKFHEKFGKEKKRLRPKKQVKAINIDQLMQMMPKLLARGKAGKEAGMTAVDGKKTGFDKLLSKGSLSQKLLVKNIAASKKAIEKIEKAGGRFEGPRPEKALPKEEQSKKEEKEGLEEKREEKPKGLATKGPEERPAGQPKEGEKEGLAKQPEEVGSKERLEEGKGKKEKKVEEKK